MNVLITGATGLVGSQIADLFISKGHTVHYLTTRSSAIRTEPNYKGFLWNVKNMTIDSSCIDGVDTIIHLAGESVFQRWTAAAKESIMSSRIDSTQLLVDLLKDNDHKVQQVITASAIGIYPDDQDAEAFKENDIPPYADNYLADVCIAWESIAQQFRETGVKLSIVRIGIVLAAQGGALEQMAQPVKFYAGAGFGNGKMWQSWIAIDDLVGIFYYMSENRLEGVYNGVAPHPVRNRPMMEAIGKAMGKPVFLPNVPKFVMKLMLGEMAAVVLSSQHVSSARIEEAGFQFQYPQLNQALKQYLD
ncbi:cell division inhibitor [Nonlabens ulvanivorans]|uniref:Cell division inhibitor n=1 Tax=Nonlabens ulvanivorans TaxID=906888 RepID=A0A090QDJ0_NONUL|nr:TIGR01777 family oxidoreductase [Nonlabens ulvanivorans]GAL00308.1 cell division inhibitor [Nonlabens ulvanivorans]